MVSGKEQNLKQQASGTSQSQHCKGKTHTSSRIKNRPHVNGNSCSSKSTTNRGGRDSASRRNRDNITGLTNGRGGKVNGEGCSSSATPKLSEMDLLQNCVVKLNGNIDDSSLGTFIKKKSDFLNDDLQSDASNKQSDDDSTLSSDSNSSNTTIQSRVIQTLTRIRNEGSGQANQIVSITEKELISFEWPKINGPIEDTQTVNSTANPNELHKLSSSSVTDLATELSVECNISEDANLPVDFVVADSGPISDENPVAMLENLGAAYCDNLPSPDSGINVDTSQCIEYQFKIVSQDVGRLIGFHGRVISKFRRDSGAEIYVTDAVEDEPDVQFCVLTGNQSQIDHALDLITAHFPHDRYPHFDTKAVIVKPYTLTCSSSLQATLPNTSSFQAVLSATCSPGEFFIQLPNQYFYHLAKLSESITEWYETKPDAPGFSCVQIGNICVARLYSVWYRAQVCGLSPDTGICRILFLDYGGYAAVPLSTLRQINGLFMQLPFQAVLCSLARIMPADGVMWTPEAVETFEMIARGRMLSASVAGFTETGIPCLDLWASIGGYNDTYINEKMVQQGHARLNPIEEMNIQITEEINRQMVEGANNPQVAEGVNNPEIVEGLSNPEITGQVSNPEITGQVSNPEITGEVSNPEITEEVSNPQTAEEASNPETAEGASNPQSAEKVSHPQTAEGVSNPQITEGAISSQAAEGTSNPQAAEELSS